MNFTRIQKAVLALVVLMISIAFNTLAFNTLIGFGGISFAAACGILISRDGDWELKQVVILFVGFFLVGSSIERMELDYNLVTVISLLVGLGIGHFVE